ncbi:hypothetical protein MXB_2203 [Myxobolus squamalis]|nr:hypothetical protein MXB_2203 [Myxobolus squamalis]
MEIPPNIDYNLTAVIMPYIQLNVNYLSHIMGLNSAEADIGCFMDRIQSIYGGKEKSKSTIKIFHQLDDSLKSSIALRSLEKRSLLNDSETRVIDYSKILSMSLLQIIEMYKDSK